MSRDASSAGPSEPQPARPAFKRLPVGRGAAREPAPDRRLNILLAAEKLFALKGYNGVSIRDIAAEAGVPFALVTYYYGAKQELYHSIFESWSSTMSARLSGLQAALAKPDALGRLESILDAFVTPVIELHSHPEGRYYALMAARDLALPSPEADRAHREFFDPMARAFIDALATAAPGATRGQVAWCYQFMLGALTHHLTDQRVERLSDGENHAADPRAKGVLLDFVAAGFRAVLGIDKSAKATQTRRRKHP